VYVDHVELEYSPFNAARTSTSLEVKQWLDTGDSRSFDVPAIARRAKATVYARVDKNDGGPATVELTFLEAKLVDDPASPYATAVQSVKSLQRSASRGEIDAVKKESSQLTAQLGGERATFVPAPIAVVAPPPVAPTSSMEAMPQVEIYMELQAVEDLLTGSEGERREGLDKLHQLIRSLRSR
jgi:hypothetical protein